MIFRKKFFVARITILSLVFVILSSCVQPLSSADETGSLLLNIVVPSYSTTLSTTSGRFIHPDTNKIVITVTASDMNTLTETNSGFSGETEIAIQMNSIPSGDNRAINIALYDDAEILLAEGKTIINIRPRRNHDVSITAIPVTNKVLVIGTASGVIPSQRKGKTIGYSVDVVKSGTYLVSSDSSSNTPIVLNVYDNKGKKVPPVLQLPNSFSLSAEIYYVMASFPTNYTGGATIKISVETPIISTYKVTYNGNENTGGTVPVDEKKYKEGDSVIASTAGSPVKAGMIFAGWNTELDGSGTTYAAGEIFSMGSGDVILYAQWVTRTMLVTVSFENPLEPEFNLPQNSSVDVDGQISISAKSGFDSYTWYLNEALQVSTGKTLSLTAGSSTPNIIIPGFNTVTLVVKSGEEYYSAAFIFKVIQ